MKDTGWQIIFCSSCGEPITPDNGMMTDHNGFMCDYCMNTGENSEPQEDTRLH